MKHIILYLLVITVTFQNIFGQNTISTTNICKIIKENSDTVGNNINYHSEFSASKEHCKNLELNINTVNDLMSIQLAFVNRNCFKPDIYNHKFYIKSNTDVIEDSYKDDGLYYHIVIKKIKPNKYRVITLENIMYFLPYGSGNMTTITSYQYQ